MTYIAFQGPSHFRVLDASDLKVAGVEGFTKTSFPRRVPVEVEPKFAQAILERPRLFGAFKEQDPAPAEVAAEVAEAERRIELTSDDAVDSGAASEDTGSSARKTSKKTT